MKQKEPYLNTPLRCCDTCAYCVKDTDYRGRFSHCSRFQLYCSTAVGFRCGEELDYWRPRPPEPPIPPTRSLRQWFYDTFWKIEEAA